MTNDGSILFPSITVCKNEMYDDVKYFNGGMLKRIQSGEVSSENAKSWFMNRTFSRDHLVKFLSIKTVEGSNQYPCNAASGPRDGEPCSFPFIYPDCQQVQQVALCVSEPGIAPVEYRGCYKEDSGNDWCYTRTYHNRSQIKGEWGYCSHHCTNQTIKSVSIK